MFIFGDSMDNYGLVSDMGRNWTTASATGSLPPTDSRYGGYVYKGNLSGITMKYRVSNVPNTTDTFFVSMLFKLNTSKNFIQSILTAQIDSKEQFNVYVGDTTHVYMKVFNVDVRTLWSTKPLRKNLWNRLEFKFKVADVGLFEMRLNGEQVITFTGNMTGDDSNPGINDPGLTDVLINIPGNMSGSSVDDILIWDDTVGDNLNDWIGDFHMETLNPVADVVGGTWVPSTTPAGAHFVDVDEIQLDHDVTYVKGASAGLQDFYQMSNIVKTTQSIIGIQTISSGRSAGSAGSFFRMNIDSGSNVSNGITNTMGPSYVYFNDYFATDPQGSIPWTEIRVNQLNVGIETL